MITGKNLKNQLEDARDAVTREHVTISNLILDGNRSLEKLHAKEAGLWKKFASIHLVEGDYNTEELERMKSKRSEQIEKAHRSIDIATKEIADLTDQVGKITDRHDKASEAARSKHAEVDEAANKDGAVVEARARLADVETSLSAARKRKSDAEADVSGKRSGYDSDELFCYLKDRNYGGEDYRPGPFTATLDRLLASAIGFDKAMQDYQLLTGLPAWIEAKISDLEGKRISEASRLSEATAKYEAIMAPYIKTVHEIEHELSVAHASIDAAEINKSSAVSYLGDVARGTDALQIKIVDECVNLMKREKVSALERLAKRTKSTDDDAALEEIERIETQAGKIVEESKILKKKLAGVAARLSNIEAVDRKIKSNGWNKSGHKFREGSCDIDGLVRGVVLADVFLRSAQSGHVEPEPDYTSNWSSGSSRSSGGFGGSDSWSSGGGFGSDSSWSSGGSFGGGGGGFSTGDGF